jgi:hypothetical protein
MKRFLAALTLITLILSVFTFTFVSFTDLASATTTYQISGYVVDPNGATVAGATLSFSNASVPGPTANSAGYFSVNVPAGTYHLYVWPPFNSSFINYDEANFAVNAAMSKNITLNYGCKIWGYITNSTGTPMIGASVLFSVGNSIYGSGYFTRSDGFYFAALQSGTYKLNAHPQTAYDPNYSGLCTYFPTYIENNVAVYGDVVKNLTVGIAQVTPTPTSQPAPTLQPTQNPTVAPTTQPIPTQPAPTQPPLPASHLSISPDSTAYQVGSTILLNGKLTDANGNTLSDETVILSYAAGGSNNWVQVGSGKTNATGFYTVQWLIPASGTFAIKAQWTGSTSYRGSENTVTLSFLPVQGQNVFFVESNSTISSLNFDSASQTLGFTASGPTGTQGYTKVTIAKTLAPNADPFMVSLDGNQLNYTITSLGDNWILAFSYQHSSHQIVVNLASDVSQLPSSPPNYTIFLFGGVAAAVVATLAGLLVLRRTHRKP